MLCSRSAMYLCVCAYLNSAARAATATVTDAHPLFTLRCCCCCCRCCWCVLVFAVLPATRSNLFRYASYDGAAAAALEVLWTGTPNNGIRHQPAHGCIYCGIKWQTVWLLSLHSRHCWWVCWSVSVCARAPSSNDGSRNPHTFIAVTGVNSGQRANACVIYASGSERAGRTPGGAAV